MIDFSTHARDDNRIRWGNGDGDVLYDGFDFATDEGLIKPYKELNKDYLITLLVRREKRDCEKCSLSRKSVVLHGVNDVFARCDVVFEAGNSLLQIIDDHIKNCSITMADHRQSLKSKNGHTEEETNPDTRIQYCAKFKGEFKVREGMVCSACTQIF